MMSEVPSANAFNVGLSFTEYLVLGGMRTYVGRSLQTFLDALVHLGSAATCRVLPVEMPC